MTDPNIGCWGHIASPHLPLPAPCLDRSQCARFMQMPDRAKAASCLRPAWLDDSAPCPSYLQQDRAA
jgi:hypothetical protein